MPLKPCQDRWVYMSHFRGRHKRHVFLSRIVAPILGKCLLFGLTSPASLAEHPTNRQDPPARCTKCDCSCHKRWMWDDGMNLESLGECETSSMAEPAAESFLPHNSSELLVFRLLRALGRSEAYPLGLDRDFFFFFFFLFCF